MVSKYSAKHCAMDEGFDAVFAWTIVGDNTDGKILKTLTADFKPDD